LIILEFSKISLSKSVCCWFSKSRNESSLFPTLASNICSFSRM